jgi:hypothetical protein
MNIPTKIALLASIALISFGLILIKKPKPINPYYYPPKFNGEWF